MKTYQARPLLFLMRQCESCAAYAFSLVCYGCMAGFRVIFSIGYSLISLINCVFRHTDTLYKSPVSKFPVPTFDEEVNLVQPMCLPFVCYRFMWLCERCLLTFEAWTYTFVSRYCTKTYQARPHLFLMRQSESCAAYVFTLVCYRCMSGFHVNFSI
jgi:hypothetical protein